MPPSRVVVWPGSAHIIPTDLGCWGCCRLSRQVREALLPALTSQMMTWKDNTARPGGTVIAALERTRKRKITARTQSSANPMERRLHLAGRGHKGCVLPRRVPTRTWSPLLNGDGGIPGSLPGRSWEQGSWEQDCHLLCPNGLGTEPQSHRSWDCSLPGSAPS